MICVGVLDCLQSFLPDYRVYEMPLSLANEQALGDCVSSSLIWAVASLISLENGVDVSR